MKKQIFLVLCLMLTLGAVCVSAQSDKTSDIEYKLKEVAQIHGGNGPFAVAGYRMGLRAAQELELLKGSFEMDATHESLPEVGWTCVADGIQAATGVSAGKMNLHLTFVKNQKDVRSIIVNKKTGAKMIFRLTDSFLKKYGTTPYEKLDEAGREAMSLTDEEIFQIEYVKGEREKSNPFEQRRKNKTAKSNKQ